MIAHLRGSLLEVEPDHLILDVGGVGYEVFCSTSTLDEIRQKFVSSRSEESKSLLHLWIYSHVREDHFHLFGFLEKQEKALFLSLLKVNGIGPKVALTLLSGAPWNKIYDFIESGDAKALSAFPKVGKKTAEQIILTLQGKLVRVENEKEKTLPGLQQISFALVNLGFRQPVVDQFVSTLTPDITVEEGVRRGLTALSKN